MKKFLITLLMAIIAMNAFSQSVERPAGCTPLDFDVSYNKPTANPCPRPRTPVKVAEVGQDGHTLYFEANHSSYTLYIINEDENGDEQVEYQVAVPSSTTIVSLPSSLNGIYELRLYVESGYYFYCEVEM